MASTRSRSATRSKARPPSRRSPPVSEASERSGGSSRGRRGGRGRGRGREEPPTAPVEQPAEAPDVQEVEQPAAKSGFPFGDAFGRLKQAITGEHEIKGDEEPEVPQAVFTPPAEPERPEE